MAARPETGVDRVLTDAAERSVCCDRLNRDACAPVVPVYATLNPPAANAANELDGLTVDGVET